MRCTSSRDLRNFWRSYSQCSRYHIAMCQVNTDKHAVHCNTQMLLHRKIPISNATLKFNHSVSHCYMACLPLLLRHWHFIIDTSNSFSGIYRTAIWWMLWTWKNPGNVFICKLYSDSDIVQSNMQTVWRWRTLLPNQGKSFSLYLLNVSTATQEYIVTNIRLLKEKMKCEIQAKLVLILYQIMSVQLVQILCPARSWNMKFGTRRCEEKLHTLANDVQNCL